MTSIEENSDLRERKHQSRARLARWIGRLLIPVMFLLVSASLRSDPQISAQLERGLLVVKALVLSSTEDQAEAPAKVDRNNLPAVNQLPTSKIKVNRHP